MDLMRIRATKPTSTRERTPITNEKQFLQSGLPGYSLIPTAEDPVLKMDHLFLHYAAFAAASFCSTHLLNGICR
jgi:hypothetical protein